MNQLILGDNLQILKTIPAESIDLIYLDPPFFSNRNYEVIWGDEGEIRSFQDRWSGGIDHYIAWLKERVAEMHRTLKPTGSIFLHCDYHADAYIQVEILDKLFGINNLINKIIWKRTTTHNDSKHGAKHFGRVADIIFFYAKNTKKYTYNTQFERYTSDHIANSYNKMDETGRRFKASDMSAAQGGKSTYYEWKGVKPPQGRYWAYSKESMKQFEKENRIYYSQNGKPYLKNYLDEMPGNSVDELWFNCVFRNKSERVGYPTQKPEALMQRIIQAASNENDTILDPFVGGGTTIAVADKLNRNWIAIDQSVQAIKVTEFRLNQQQNLFSKPFTLTLHKYDYDKLNTMNPFDFETFIITQTGGTPQNKKGGDKGIDGKSKNNTPIQVKQSEDIGRNVIDNFLSAIQRHDKNLYEKNKENNLAIGIIIAFSFGKGAIQEVARLKNSENIIIQLVRVDEIIPIAKKPTLKISIQETTPETPLSSRRELDSLPADTKHTRTLTLTAIAQSPAGIEFYAWDFTHNPTEGFKPQILRDTIGIQTHPFKAGTHIIAVKVVDNNGLDTIETIKLKINGVIEQS